jgi:uncharacterized damage-inducible protein DinB
MIQMFLKELEQEAQTTRRMLSRIPTDKFGWKPHEKSMTVQQLATHIAELPLWISMTLDTSELDFAKNPYQQENVPTTQDLMNYFESSVADGKARLEKATEDELSEPWTLRNGEVVYVTAPKADMLRSTYCQVVHHRAQMGVYLRLLNVPIPGSYGPSADEQF